MAGYNRIVMVGNLTRDPEYKQLPSGQAVCQLGLAANRQYRNKQTGSMVQEVCFVDIDVFGPQAESCKQYLQKGRAVLVEGRLKFDSWETPEGQKRTKHSIVADRVVFLSVNTADQEGFEKNNNNREKSSGNNDLMNEFLGAQQEAPEKTKKQATSRSPEETVSYDEGTASNESHNATENTSFEDEPPFQDDLPF